MVGVGGITSTEFGGGCPVHFADECLVEFVLGIYDEADFSFIATDDDAVTGFEGFIDLAVE